MTDTFDHVVALLVEGRRGLTLDQLAAAGAIARELDSGRNREDRLEQLCRKAGTSLRALRSHLARCCQGAAGEQLDFLTGGSGAGPDPVSSRAPRGSDPRARAALADRTGHDSHAA